MVTLISKSPRYVRITIDRKTLHVRRRMAIKKIMFNKEKQLLTGELNVYLKKRTANSLIWSTVMYPYDQRGHYEKGRRMG